MSKKEENTNERENGMNDAKLEKIAINGVNYVPESQAKANPEVVDNYHIVRTYSAGVFAGEIVERNGKEVLMKNARRLWYWSGAASLSQLAMEGVKNPDQCKFPCEVTEIRLMEAVEITPCTEVAIKSIKEVPAWKN